MDLIIYTYAFPCVICQNIIYEGDLLCRKNKIKKQNFVFIKWIYVMKFHILHNETL